MKKLKLLTIAAGCIFAAASTTSMAAVVSQGIGSAYENAGKQFGEMCKMVKTTVGFIDNVVNTKHGGDISEYTTDGGLYSSDKADELTGEALAGYTALYTGGNIELQITYPSTAAQNELLNGVKVLCKGSAGEDAKAGIDKWVCTTDLIERAHFYAQSANDLCLDMTPAQTITFGE